MVKGPFTPPKDLVAGCWLFQVGSRDEAVEWVKRGPNAMPGTAAGIEIRPVFEAEDLGDALPPEVHEQKGRRRAQPPSADLPQRRPWAGAESR